MVGLIERWRRFAWSMVLAALMPVAAGAEVGDRCLDRLLDIHRESEGRYEFESTVVHDAVLDGTPSAESIFASLTDSGARAPSASRGSTPAGSCGVTLSSGR